MSLRLLKNAAKLREWESNPCGLAYETKLAPSPVYPAIYTLESELHRTLALAVTTLPHCDFRFKDRRSFEYSLEATPPQTMIRRLISLSGWRRRSTKLNINSYLLPQLFKTY